MRVFADAGWIGAGLPILLLPIYVLPIPVTYYCSCDMKSAAKVARSVYDQVARRDPHATRLTAAPNAGNLFAVYADNCAPVTGHVRRDVEEECDVDSADLIPLLTMLAPEVKEGPDS